jgi:hypothetical protein
VLLLVVCGTVCGCDDYDEVVEWGETHLDFLCRYRPYHHGLPCPDWLRTLMNRLDPALFQTCSCRSRSRHPRNEWDSCNKHRRAVEHRIGVLWLMITCRTCW